MRLYDLSAQFNDIIDLLEADSTNEALYAMLDGLDIVFDNKVESIAKLMKSKSAEFDAIAAEAKRLTDRATKIANEREWLYEYIQQNMKQMGKTEVKSLLFKIKLQSNPPSVNVIDESKIPGKYFILPPPPEKKLDKRKLLEDLKNEMIVEGATIKQEQRLVIK